MRSNGQGTDMPFPWPCALFMGDFNVGKSALINALLRRDVLVATREESRALPTFLARSEQRQASFVALTSEGDAALAIEPKSHDEFLDIRRDSSNGVVYRALAARLPATPFQQLVMVDTPGMSSDSLESVHIQELAEVERALFVVVTDIEYWSARHTMDFIAAHQQLFGDALVVVANKADHCNADEIERISAKAQRRMERYGIRPAPRFFALSARLEQARRREPNEYRSRIKPDVRFRCDAGFDAFRLALYEFEARKAAELPSPAFHQLLGAPVALSFIQAQQEVTS